MSGLQQWVQYGPTIYGKNQLDGKSVLIYIEPETNTPGAVFVDAKTAKREQTEVRLDNGTAVRAGLVIDSKGKRQTPERPQQIFTRWYGFALTFSGTEVYGQ